MKFQAIGPDNMAALNGEWFKINLAQYGWHPAYHALQFDDETGGGEIEWMAINGHKPANLPINRDQLSSMFGPLMAYVRALIDAKRAEEAAAHARKVAELEAALAAAKGSG